MPGHKRSEAATQRGDREQPGHGAQQGQRWSIPVLESHPQWGAGGKELGFLGGLKGDRARETEAGLHAQEIQVWEETRVMPTRQSDQLAQVCRDERGIRGAGLSTLRWDRFRPCQRWVVWPWASPWAPGTASVKRPLDQRRPGKVLQLCGLGYSSETGGSVAPRDYAGEARPGWGSLEPQGHSC